MTRNDAGRKLPEPVDAFSIPLFCAMHDFSPAHYYRLKAAGLGPKEMKIGHRVLISREAAERWRRQREQATP
jgi:hypothetical protein